MVLINQFSDFKNNQTNKEENKFIKTNMQTIIGSGGAIGVELATALTEYTTDIRLVSRNPEKVNSTDQLSVADITKREELEKAVADLIKERFPKLNGDVLINSIGTTIGSHTGPGTVALFYWGQKRED